MPEGRKCYVQLLINQYVGTQTVSSWCLSLSASQCVNKWQLDWIFGKRQCKYDYGINKCIMSDVCS